MSRETLSRIVGAAHVLHPDSPAAAVYRGRFGYVAGRPKHALEAIVRPGSAEQLVEVLRTLKAGSRGLLVTCNDTGNGAVCDWSDMPLVLVDLTRMQRILDVNVEYAHALVEPGVSFASLRAHLQREQIPLWIDTDRNAGHSVCGSILSRQYGYGPYGDHFGLQCGAEFVLRDGLMVRTGMGAVPENPAWQIYKYALGPYSDGLFAQSGLGVPTKIGLWLMPPPPRYEPFAFQLRKHDDIVPLVEALRPLKLANAIPNNVAIVNASWNYAPFGREATKADDAWTAYGALYGLPDTVAMYLDILHGIAAGIPGARLRTGAELDDGPARERAGLMRGEASLGQLGYSPLRADRCLSLSFAAPMEGELSVQMVREAESLLATQQLPLLAEFALTSLTSRTQILQLQLPWRLADGKLTARAVSAAEQLITRMGQLGFGLVGESFELGYLAHRLLGPSPGDALVERLKESA